jgi:glycosyltransferase involved in cell wall biosynthesis
MTPDSLNPTPEGTNTPSGAYVDGKPPRVFIGMPVFNGCPYIEDALQSLTTQTFQDWRLLIADNCSTDATADICKRFTDADSRITYVRHEKNHGAGYNFRYVLDAAKSEFFMWAAADDVWHHDFMSEMVRLLDLTPTAGAAFCGIENIDSFGASVRAYQPFLAFSCPPMTHRAAIANYLWAPEILGKANLVYGLYQRDVLSARILPLLSSRAWGSDMAFVLSVMCRKPFAVSDRTLFFKRYARPSDRCGAPDMITTSNASPFDLDRALASGYTGAVLQAAAGTRFFSLAFRIAVVRCIGSVLYSLASDMRRLMLRMARSLCTFG